MKSVVFAMVVVIIFFVGAFLFLSKSQTPQAPIDVNKESEGQPPKTQGYKENAISAVIKTAKGDIALELYPKAAPITVNNFVKLAADGFYNGIKFHRVIPSFMIQGGDPLSRTDSRAVGTGGPGYMFKDEINPKSLGLSDAEIAQLEAQGYRYNYNLESLPVDVGVIAMANSGPDTNGSQFFIVTYEAQPHLNGKHTVFGKVIGGMDVVRAIVQGDVMTTIQIGGK